MSCSFKNYHVLIFGLIKISIVSDLYNPMDNDIDEMDNKTFNDIVAEVTQNF